MLFCFLGFFNMLFWELLLLLIMARNMDACVLESDASNPNRNPQFGMQWRRKQLKGVTAWLWKWHHLGTVQLPPQHCCEAALGSDPLQQGSSPAPWPSVFQGKGRSTPHAIFKHCDSHYVTREKVNDLWLVTWFQDTSKHQFWEYQLYEIMCTHLAMWIISQRYFILIV